MLRYSDNTFYRHHVTTQRAVSSLGEVFKAATLFFNRQKAMHEYEQKALVKVMVDLYNLDSGAIYQRELYVCLFTLLDGVDMPGCLD